MFVQPLPASAGATASIVALLERRTGQQIAAGRVWRIETVLKPIVRDHGLASIDQLAAELRRLPGSPLCDAVVEALLNHETSFFRDGQVIAQLVDAVEVMSHEDSARKMRVWSAGCSTGQEPLSLAMSFATLQQAGRMAFPEIIATDVSDDAVARARAARYSQFEIQRGLPVRSMIEWFDDEGGEWVARRALTDRVRYRTHNLVSDAPMPGRFDLILCRNVLMYFAPELRRGVFDRLALAIRPGGLLVLGAGETVIGQTDAFEPSDTHRGFYRPRTTR